MGPLYALSVLSVRSFFKTTGTVLGLAVGVGTIKAVYDMKEDRDEALRENENLKDLVRSLQNENEILREKLKER